MTTQDEEILYQCLQSVAEITQYSNVPILGVTALPDTLVGFPGEDGIDGQNGEDGFVSFIVNNIDSDLETVDQVDAATYEACRWDYIVNRGPNYRAGTVLAVHDGTTVSFYEDSTADIGDTADLTIYVDLAAGNFRLMALSTSDDWTVKGKRYLIYE